MRSSGRSVPAARAAICFATVMTGSCLSAQDSAKRMESECGAASPVRLPLPARYAISAAMGRDEQSFHVECAGAGLRADNARHALRAVFGADGVEIRFGQRRLGVCLEAVGYGDALRPVSRAEPTADGNRVEYWRGPVIEWWVNGPLGLQQGFTLAQPPGEPRGEPLTLSLVLRGDLAVAVDDDGRGLSLATRGGAAVLRYAGLLAHDASGRHLDAWLEARDSRLWLRVADAGARYPVVIDPFVEAARLTASRGAAHDIFGRSVAISGDTVVVGTLLPNVGATQGAAYVFVKPITGWASVTETAKLTPTVGPGTAGFGEFVAIRGDTIVVGAQLPDIGANQGAAYVYVKPPTGWVSATQTAKLTASGRSATDGFGFSVAVGGDTVVVGAPQTAISSTANRGAVYLYGKPAAGWADATETARLTTSNPAGRTVGHAVSIRGDTVVAGAPATTVGGNVAQGAAFVFEKPATGWANGTEIAMLTASDGAAGDHFGDLAMEGDTVVVGASRADVGGNQDQGAVYVFEKPVAGWANTTETAKLTASDGAPCDLLGYAVSIEGDAVVGAAPFADVGGNGDRGAAYVFEKPVTGWIRATETVKLAASDGAAGDQFSESVAIEGGVVVVGARYVDIGENPDQGAVYLFDRPEVFPSSGCGLPAVVASGARRIGTSLTLSMSSCATGSTHGFVLGTSRAVPFGLPAAVACGGISPCLVSCGAFLDLPGPVTMLAIPDDPALVGFVLCVQGVCVEVPPCLRLTDMVTVTISS